MIIEIQGKRVEVPDSFRDMSPEEQQAYVDKIANEMAASSEGAEPSQEYDASKPAAGAVIGTTLGAMAGPAVGQAVDIAAQSGAQKVLGPDDAKNRAISNWLKTQTTGPDVGGATYKEAFKKSETARGVPIQSRGSQIPIRKGFLGVQNQPPEPTMPQKAAANIMEGERLNKPGIPRRVAGMGIMGAEAGKMMSDLEQGNYADAAVSGLGAAGGAMSQSRIRPIRALGTGLSALVPLFQGGKEAKQLIAPPPPPEEKAAGGLVYLSEGGKPPKLPGKFGGAAKLAAEAIKNQFIPTPTKIVKASEAFGPNEGKFILPTQSDRMRSTMGDLGGGGFSKFQLEKPEYAEAKAAWGVGKKPTATGIVNVNKKYGDQAIWTPMLGSETQHHSNQHVFDMLAEEFNRQARLGNLPKELREKINTKLANAKDTKGLFPEEFDIGNPEHLIKYGDTFNRRGALSTVMSGQGVGGTKGRIIDYPGIMQEMTDPMTIGAPTHSLGPRLFTLNNEIEYRPDLHSAFPYILKGTDQGVAFAPVPKELGIPDFIKQFKEFKGREPGYYDLVRTIPSQQITDKYLRNLEAAGYKEGGKVTPAWQRKEGKSPSGGLNALGRASYKRETGGELKAPQPEGGSRKKSFCARMGGMKKKLTSSKTANDPDSRINKALRKWKC